MRRLVHRFVLLAALLGGFYSTVNAAGDPGKGAPMAETCFGCHGIESYTNVYPTYRVPKLGGQHAEYIRAALIGYRSGERNHPTMNAHASGFSDEDIDNIAAFFASIEK